MSRQTEFLLGTAVKIETIFETAPDTVKIKILNPNYTVIVDNVNMTQETTLDYTYIYQSVEATGIEGEYIVTITSTVNGKDTVKQEVFNMVKPAPYGTLNAY